MGKMGDFMSGFLGSLGNSADTMTQLSMMKQMFPQGTQNTAAMKAQCDAQPGVEWDPVSQTCVKSGVGRPQPEQGGRNSIVDYGADLGMTGMGGSDVRRRGGN